MSLTEMARRSHTADKKGKPDESLSSATLALLTSLRESEPADALEAVCAYIGEVTDRVHDPNNLPVLSLWQDKLIQQVVLSKMQAGDRFTAHSNSLDPLPPP